MELIVETQHLTGKTDIRPFGQRRFVLKLACVIRERPFLGQTRRERSSRPARWRSQALKPPQRHAEGVGLDGDAQRQAIVSGP